MAATSAPRGANFGQQGSNFGPTWLQNGASWTHLATISAQVEVHTASKWGIWPAQSEILKTRVLTGISHFFWASMTLRVEQCSPCVVLGPTRANFADSVGPKLEPTDPSSAQVRKDGQVWPQSALVGPRTPAPFLSIQFSGCGRFSSRSDSNKIASAKADHVATLRFGSFWAAKSVNPWSVAVCESVISGQKLKQRWHYRVLSCKWHPELAVPRISWQQGRCMYHAAGVRVAHEAPDLPVVKKPTEQSQQLLPWNANHQNFTCR